MARLEGLEPSTVGLEGQCSIQLSYRRINDSNHDSNDRDFDSGRGREI